MILAALFAISLTGQAATIKTSTNEVVVDVVVRDKKGRLIKGLTEADFTVLEDGAAQSITSLRESAGSLAVGGGNPRPR